MTKIYFKTVWTHEELLRIKRNGRCTTIIQPTTTGYMIVYDDVMGIGLKKEFEFNNIQNLLNHLTKRWENHYIKKSGKEYWIKFNLEGVSDMLRSQEPIIGIA